jgi:hypothetical protein
MDFRALLSTDKSVARQPTTKNYTTPTGCERAYTRGQLSRSAVEVGHWSAGSVQDHAKPRRAGRGGGDDHAQTLQLSLSALLREFPILQDWIDDEDARLGALGTFHTICETLEACSLPDDATDALLIRDGLLGVAQAALLMAHHMGMDTSEPQISVAEGTTYNLVVSATQAQSVSVTLAVPRRGKSGRHVPPLDVLREVMTQALAWHLSVGQGPPKNQADLCAQITEHQLYRVKGNPSGGMSDKTLSRYLGDHNLRYEDELARAYPDAVRKLRVLRARTELKRTAADSA